ncbi:hypothetical protein R6Q59_019687 [Mikania micrantha]
MAQVGQCLFIKPLPNKPKLDHTFFLHYLSDATMMVLVVVRACTSNTRQRSLVKFLMLAHTPNPYTVARTQATMNMFTMYILIELGSRKEGFFAAFCNQPPGFETQIRTFKFIRLGRGE